MKLRFFADAEVEVEEAQQFLADRSPELGFGFLDDLSETLARIAANPEEFPSLESRGEQTPFRRAKLATFQYFALFELLATEIVVLAIVHVRRAPHDWQETSQ